MLTTGVDITEIDRIRDLVDRWGDRFLRRIYTDDELDYCRGRAQNLAVRFAAKEATMKALATGARAVGWKDIEVVRGAGGAPSLNLSGRALRRAQKLGVKEVSISLSHSRDLAIAFVVGFIADAEEEEPETEP